MHSGANNMADADVCRLKRGPYRSKLKVPRQTSFNKRNRLETASREHEDSLSALNTDDDHYDEQCDEFEDTGCPSQLEMLTAATHRYLTISLMSIHLYVKIYNQGCILVHYSHQPWVTYSSEATQHTITSLCEPKVIFFSFWGFTFPVIVYCHHHCTPSIKQAVCRHLQH